MHVFQGIRSSPNCSRKVYLALILRFRKSPVLPSEALVTLVRVLPFLFTLGVQVGLVRIPAYYLFGYFL